MQRDDAWHQAADADGRAHPAARIDAATDPRTRTSANAVGRVTIEGVSGGIENDESPAVAATRETWRPLPATRTV